MSTLTQQPSASVTPLPETAPAHVFAGLCERAAQGQQTEEVLRIADYGLRCHPDHPDLLAFRAEALLFLNRKPDAEAALRSAVAREPLHPRAVYLLAQLLVSDARWRDALPFIDRADLIQPGNGDVQRWLALAEQNKDLPQGQAQQQAPLASSKQTAALVEGLVGVAGVQSVAVSDEKETRSFGPAGPAGKAVLKSLATLEDSVQEVLSAVGFGHVLETSVRTGNRLLMARHSPSGAIRLAAEPRVREGLLSWHCDRILGGATQ